MKNYVTKIYIYNDIVWDDLETILHETNISHNNKFIEPKIYMSCKINDDIEIRVYKDEFDLHALFPPFLGWDVNTLYVHVAGEMICENIRENLGSEYNFKCTLDMKKIYITIKFVSRCGNMTYRYQLQQPRPMIESKMVKHIK